MKTCCAACWLTVSMMGAMGWAESPAAAPVPASKPVTQPTTQPAATQPAPLKISDVVRLKEFFNPSQGQAMSMRFQLSKPAKVKVDIHGPNGDLIRRLLKSEPMKAGLNTVAWDGKGDDGNIVPDEAYTFDIAAIADEETDVWDPVFYSGGERVIAAELKPLDQNRFSYQIPKPCRVLVRVGVENGPLVRTLVNWQPRAAGFCLEYHDGMDAGGVRRIGDIKDVRIAVIAMALPDQALITVGNSATTYREYYGSIGSSRPHKPKMARTATPESLISPQWLIPVHLNRDPELVMKLLDIDDAPAKPEATSQPAGVQKTDSAEAPPASQPTTQPALTSGPAPTVIEKSPVLVRIDVKDPVDRNFMNEQKFELIVYVDDKRILEVEQGHIPFTYPWEVSALTPGLHVLTINISSFRNHVGTASRLVDIKR